MLWLHSNLLKSEAMTKNPGKPGTRLGKSVCIAVVQPMATSVRATILVVFAVFLVVHHFHWLGAV